MRPSVFWEGCFAAAVLYAVQPLQRHRMVPRKGAGHIAGDHYPELAVLLQDCKVGWRGVQAVGVLLAAGKVCPGRAYSARQGEANSLA